MQSTRVYSYRRFSSGRQAHGHSLERQTASARTWCIQNGHELDEEFEFADIATSAYTGKNATEGALAAFLMAAKGGRIPSGSILLVESLDRLSRNNLTEAMSLLTSIVRSGVRVVSLLDGKEWNQENINDTMSFMMSVLLFARAHEESATKAKRVRAAFAKKRDAGLPVVSNGHGPGWAYPRADRQGWELEKTKAESVRKVFEYVANGQGGVAIARIANTEGWALPWRERANTNTRWEHTQVSRLVRDRRVLGEWQPKQMVDGQLLPLGEPVVEYFPRVISDVLWGHVHIALSGRKGIPRIRGVKADLLAGLLYCDCGEKMQRKAPSGRGYARYYCLGRSAGITKCASVSEENLIDYGFSFLATLEASQFQQTDALLAKRAAMDEANAKLADFDKRATRLLDLIEEGGESRLMGERLRGIEIQQRSLQNTIKNLGAELAGTPKSGADFGALFAADVRAALLNTDAVKERHRISTALSRLVEKMVWDGGDLVKSEAKYAEAVKKAGSGIPSTAKPKVVWLKIYTKRGDMFAQAIPIEAIARVLRRDKGTPHASSPQKGRKKNVKDKSGEK